MDQFWQILESPGASSNLTPEAIILSFLLAFILGQLMAWIYCWTHSGLSYSRSFTQALILLTIVVSMVMIVIDNNIVTAFGLLGALAIIRFRNVLKDTRDTVFIFACLVVGMAVGSQRFASALLGAVAFLLVALYVHFTAFGSRNRYDGYLHFRINMNEVPETKLRDILHKFCFQARQVSSRQSGSIQPLTDCTYQVRLRDYESNNDMVSELEAMQGVEEVALNVQEDLAEA
jgi:uncharacterized membrane protein YhiD involved in acid resistance